MKVHHDYNLKYADIDDLVSIIVDGMTTWQMLMTVVMGTFGKVNQVVSDLLSSNPDAQLEREIEELEKEMGA